MPICKLSRIKAALAAIVLMLAMLGASVNLDDVFGSVDVHNAE